MTRYIHKISRYTPSLLQGTLQLEVARPRTGLARELPLERHALPGLALVLAVVGAAYLYFVASSIVNVMAQRDAEHSMRVIESSMGSLEQRYMTLSRSIAAKEAGSIGLAPVEASAYVYRPIDTAMAVTERSQI